MKEIPILFSSVMVQANLERRKTQTRRLMKPQPYSVEYDNGPNDSPTEWWVSTKNKKFPTESTMVDNESELFLSLHRFGKPGDLLWVRESGWVDNNHVRFLNTPILFWAADLFSYDGHTQSFIQNHTCRFPSIHMYKEFARIWLENVSVRAERLQDISEEDAIAEGVYIDKNCGPGEKYTVWGIGHFPTAKAAYKDLWETLNGAESWNENPWVWVIEYKILSTEGKPA